MNTYMTYDYIRISVVIYTRAPCLRERNDIPMDRQHRTPIRGYHWQTAQHNTHIHMTQLISRGRDSSNHTADFSIHKHIMEYIPSQSTTWQSPLCPPETTWGSPPSRTVIPSSRMEVFYSTVVPGEGLISSLEKYPLTCHGNIYFSI